LFFAQPLTRCRLRGGGDTLDDPEPIIALHKQFPMLGEFEKQVVETGGTARRRRLPPFMQVS
jgi:hypothetical protein